MTTVQEYSKITMALDGKVLENWCDLLINNEVAYGLSNKQADQDVLVKAINLTMDNVDECMVEVLTLLPAEGFEISPNMCVNNTAHELTLFAANQKLKLVGKFVRTQLVYAGGNASLLMKFVASPALWEPV